MMRNKIIELINDNIITVSDNFNVEKTTCLEYGGLDELLLSFEINEFILDIKINPDCYYRIDGIDYVDSMVAEEDMEEYLKGNFSIDFMNYFYIETKKDIFVFHDMNEDFERFLEFIEEYKNSIN